MSMRLVALLSALSLLAGIQAQACAKSKPSALDKLEEQAELASFVELLKLVGLDGKFDDRSYTATVFAPQNSVIGTFLDYIQDLNVNIQDHPDLAKEIMQYHIVEGEQLKGFPQEGFATDDLTLESLVMKNPKAGALCPKESQKETFGSLTIQRASGTAKPVVVARATRGSIAKSIQACGVAIHIITNVLVPCTEFPKAIKSAEAARLAAEAKENGTAPPPELPVAEAGAAEPDGAGALAEGKGAASDLAEGEEEADELVEEDCLSLVELLEEEGLSQFSGIVSGQAFSALLDYPGTVFAVTDKAIAALMKKLKLTGTLAEAAPDLAQVLLGYHLSGSPLKTSSVDFKKTVATEISPLVEVAETLCTGSVAETFTIQMVKGTTSSKPVISTRLQKNVSFNRSNLETCQGVVHVLDAVLLPCGLTAESIAGADGDTDKLAEELSKKKSKDKKDTKKNKKSSPPVGLVAAPPPDALEDFLDFDYSPKGLTTDTGLEGLPTKDIQAAEELQLAERILKQSYNSQPSSDVTTYPRNQCSPRLLKSAYDFLRKNEETFSLFLQLVHLSDLADIFAAPNRMTLFLPTNAAIIKAFVHFGYTPTEVFKSLQNIEKGEMQLRAMVMYHVIPYFLRVQQLRKEAPRKFKTIMSETTLEYEVEIYDSPCSGATVKKAQLSVNYDDEGIDLIVQGGKSFPAKGKSRTYGKLLGGSQQDIETCNSYIHVIDAMLWPCDFAGERCGSLDTALNAEENVSRFSGMLKNLNDSRYDLQDVSLHATLFAFTDNAWDNLIDANRARNLPHSLQNRFYRNMTQDILKYHMVIDQGEPLQLLTAPGSSSGAPVFVEGQQGLTNLRTIAEEFQFCPPGRFNRTLRVVARSDKVEVLGGQNRASVVTPNLPACNSWVHVINRVLLPCNLTTPLGYDQVAVEESSTEFFTGDGTDTFGDDARAGRVLGSVLLAVALVAVAAMW